MLYSQCTVQIMSHGIGLPFLIENGIQIRYSEITTKGSTLQINLSDDQESEENFKSIDTIAADTLGESVDKPFEELANEMENIDLKGYVKKKLLEEGGGDIVDESCTVSIAYSGYFKGEKRPFDLKPTVKPLVTLLRESSLLPGLHTAVLSMRVHELSMFLLSFRVMYGKLGNPPLVQPESNCLFYIKLMRSQIIPDIGHSDSGPGTFARLLHNAKEMFKNGSVFFHNSNIPMAIRCFNRAVNTMHNARLADEEDQKKQEALLIKLYFNLAICYNHVKNPRRACCMCNEINRLQNIWNNGNALYQNAKALRMIGVFDGAKKKLNRAMQLCPDRKEIEEEMQKINAQAMAYEQSRFLALRIDKDSEIISEGFKIEVANLVQKFVEDKEICKIALPKALNSAEMDYVSELAKQYKLNFDSVKKDVSLDKMPSSNPNKSMFDD